MKFGEGFGDEMDLQSLPPASRTERSLFSNHFQDLVGYNCCSGILAALHLWPLSLKQLFLNMKFDHQDSSAIYSCMQSFLKAQRFPNYPENGVA
ncbi:hypothetical protein CapIbe_012341 [Capra ibex]